MFGGLRRALSAAESLSLFADAISIGVRTFIGENEIAGNVARLRFGRAQS
jgi:hypothetical protein